jgi:glycosyltransferase involved in cell wall biosynthesis
MSKKVMMYAASVTSGGVNTFTSRISHALHRMLPAASWELSILGKASDNQNQLLAWPETIFKPLTHSQSQASESAYSNADLGDFRQLVNADSAAFDVLYLPSPWGNIPLGTTLPIPAPVVMNIHDFEFDLFDYSIITDQYRREAHKFATLGSAFIFSSEHVREQAVKQYQFPRERTHVIYQAPTVDGAVPAVDVRAKYNLPERFAFSLGWLSRRKNGAVLVEALGILKANSQLSIPLVTAGYEFDDVLPDNVAHQRYGERVLGRMTELGLSESIIQLGVVDEADIPALIAAAAAVIAPSKSESGLSYLMLNTMALGTPLIHARIPSVTERLGTNDAYALSFDPEAPQQLASQLLTLLNNEAAARTRAASATALVTQRTQDDVARDYIEIFNTVSALPWKTRPRQRNRDMRSREERVAWLINHTTLRDAELPIIRTLGLEVYTSKEVSERTEVRTESVDFSEDEHSTLPNWVLDRLNNHNFYDDGVPPDIAQLLNGFFGTVITTAFGQPIEDIMKVFKGRILIRAFGRELPYTYSDEFDRMMEGNFWDYVGRARNRFWLAPSYDNIPEVEEPPIRERAPFLPLTLPDRTWRAANQWVGNDRRILFVCPRIISRPQYYGKIYNEFKAHLGHLPYLVAGHQSEPVDDPNVTGFASDDQMQAWFRELRVMFYHSREPRHLHYHPLEAVVYGMPLIYMKGGLVESLMGVGKPGACDTYAEAEQKLRRILDGDEAFTRSVIESQRTLLDTFKPEFVEKKWRENFLGQVMNTSPIPDVLPFARWKKLPPPAPPMPPIPSKAGRHVAIFGLVWPYGGIYKYITGLVDTAATIAEAWKFDIIWGLQVFGEHHFPPVVWPYQSHPNLHIEMLPDPSLWQQRWQTVKRLAKPYNWRKTKIYLTNRPVRIISELLYFPLSYVQEATRQRRLRPRGTPLFKILDDSRIGRKILSNPLIKRLMPSEAYTPSMLPMPKPAQRVASAKVPQLLESPIPPFRPYLTMRQLGNIASRYEALLLGNPFRLISPNMPLKATVPQPVAITMYDLAHEFTEVWGDDTESISREMVLWGKIARIIIFGSEFIRNEAVMRYDIPVENTRIVRPSPLVIRRDAPDADEIKRVKAKLNLPDRYLFNSGYQGTHKNNIMIFQAMQILHWRGFDVPPLVLGGAEAKRLLLNAPLTGYLGAVQKMIAEGYFEVGKDIIVADYIEEDDLPAVYGGATIGISMSRSESTVHGMITESMLYGAPVIATTIPQNVEELGLEDEVALLVPLDDPVALADAIQYTLTDPQATAERIKRANVYIGAKTWEKMAGEFLEIFEEIAASRKPK